VAARSELGRISIPTDQLGNRPFDVAVLANGTALVTTTFGGSGAGASLYKVDLSTGAATLRTDFGGTTPYTWLKASGDRLYVAIASGQGPPTKVHRYSVATDAFAGALEVPRGSGGVATDADGSMIVGGGHVMSGTLTTATDLGCCTQGVAVPAAGDLAYANTQHGILTCRFGLGGCSNAGMGFAAQRVGQLVLSPDETRLVGVTDTGVVVGRPSV